MEPNSKGTGEGGASPPPPSPESHKHKCGMPLILMWGIAEALKDGTISKEQAQAYFGELKAVNETDVR